MVLLKSQPLHIVSIYYDFCTIFDYLSYNDSRYIIQKECNETKFSSKICNDYKTRNFASTLFDYLI